jgi:DNA topoisomerase-3
MMLSLAGTDATYTDHIETIKSRKYVRLQNDCHFVPTGLGMGLVECYDNMGYPMSKPHLHAELEADLKRICEGTKDPKVVLTEQLAKYKEVLQMALQQVKFSVVADAFLFFRNDFDGFFQASKVELFTCSQSVPLLMKLR